MRTLRLERGVVALVSTIFCIGSAHGEIVVENHQPDPNVSAAVWGFGWYPPATYPSETYFAQTFIAPPNATELSSIQFTLQSNGTDNPQMTGVRPFRVLVTNDASSAQYDFLPTEILFESGTLVSPYDPNPPGVFQTFRVPITGVPVTPGTTYAFVLDAFSDFAPGEFSIRTVQATSSGNFYDGEFYAARAPVDDSFMPIGTRADHFTSEFLPSGPDIDLIFEATFVPEPGSVATVAIALCIVAGIAARKCRALMRIRQQCHMFGHRE